MIEFKGLSDRAARFFEKEQLSSPETWAKFVDQFRVRLDGKNRGWRGEFWGKMMRGGALIYSYTRSQELYGILTDSVRDMLSVAEKDGRVSSYEKDAEFTGWDVWCRKYVMLGCEYYLDVCADPLLKSEVIAFLRRVADLIIERIGKGEGKIPITRATKSWLGINSSSVLEPIVRLYRLTSDRKYLDFASYIVESGGAEGIDIFEAAYENAVPPYRYGVPKAYELISCFEGLLEYYLATGIEKYRTAVLNFARAIMDTEISVIGNCGITDELLDHTKTRQTTFTRGVSQETCVTVTWMKFCSKLLALTKDASFADEIERSFYNAYLGALNVYGREVAHPRSPLLNDETLVSTFLPADSYSPLIPGRRGRLVGGGQILGDRSYYGCCASISSAGAGVFLRSAVTLEGDVLTVNFFERGTVRFKADGVPVVIRIDTDYPAGGRVVFRITAERSVRFTLKLRRPAWEGGKADYTVYDVVGKDEKIEYELPMPLVKHYPEKWDRDVIFTERAVTDWGCSYTRPVEVFHSPDDDRYIALTRGPLTLAADSRTGKDVHTPFDPFSGAEEEKNEIVPGVPCIVRLSFTQKNGERFSLVDYASAGRDWKSGIAAWLPTETLPT